MNVSPLHYEQLIASRRDDLLSEAAAERLAQEFRRPSAGARSRIAAALHALASWLDPMNAPSFLPEADRFLAAE
jgi:hypothetical protein